MLFYRSHEIPTDTASAQFAVKRCGNERETRGLLAIRGGDHENVRQLGRNPRGDEQCGDGHFIAPGSGPLRPKTVTSFGADLAVELDPNDSTSLQAQNPTNLGKLRVGVASEEAAGIPAIWNTMVYGIGEMGPLRSSEAFLKINQVTGFDCQSCAWPSPDEGRKIFEFCENGAKAVSDESTKKRIGPDFFAQNIQQGGSGRTIRLLAQSECSLADLYLPCAREWRCSGQSKVF